MFDAATRRDLPSNLVRERTSNRRTWGERMARRHVSKRPQRPNPSGQPAFRLSIACHSAFECLYLRTLFTEGRPDPGHCLLAKGLNGEQRTTPAFWTEHETKPRAQSQYVGRRFLYGKVMNHIVSTCSQLKDAQGTNSLRRMVHVCSNHSIHAAHSQERTRRERRF